MIVRRPNSRASIEYAPGPINASASDVSVNAAKIRFVGELSSQTVDTQRIPLATDTRGVRKPASSRTDSRYSGMLTQTGTGMNISAATSPEAAASCRRKRNSATPAVLAGNIENSFSTARRYVGFAEPVTPEGVIRVLLFWGMMS